MEHGYTHDLLNYPYQSHRQIIEAQARAATHVNLWTLLRQSLVQWCSLLAYKLASNQSDHIGVTKGTGCCLRRTYRLRSMQLHRQCHMQWSAELVWSYLTRCWCNWSHSYRQLSLEHLQDSSQALDRERPKLLAALNVLMSRKSHGPSHVPQRAYHRQ